MQCSNLLKEFKLFNNYKVKIHVGEPFECRSVPHIQVKFLKSFRQNQMSHFSYRHHLLLAGHLAWTTNLNKLGKIYWEIELINSVESFSTSSVSIFAHHYDFDSFLAANNSTVPEVLVALNSPKKLDMAALSDDFLSNVSLFPVPMIIRIPYRILS